jgi:hypothetical protein
MFKCIFWPDFKEWEEASDAKSDREGLRGKITPTPLAKTAAKGKSPGGKLGEVFEAASQLPRRQQQKIAEVVEGMLMLHEYKAS